MSSRRKPKKTEGVPRSALEWLAASGRPYKVESGIGEDGRPYISISCRLGDLADAAKEQFAAWEAAMRPVASKEKQP